MLDTEQSETAKTEALENNTELQTQQQETVGKSAVEVELERLKKENEKIEMERNQLRNKLQAEEDAKAKAEAAQLEEQNEYKLLFEQEKAKREEYEQEREANETKQRVSAKKQEVSAEFSDEARELADELGIDLTSDSEEAVEVYKSKLEKAQARVGKREVSANNQGTQGQSKPEPQGEELRKILADPKLRDEYYKNKGGITASMMQ